jgi:hypothetical protein
VPVGIFASGSDYSRADRLIGHADVVGRTVEIGAGFPRKWATSVRIHSAIPWVTLVFTHDGRPRLDSSLLSIANGLHDDAIRRFAADAAALRGPVYLSPFPAVDRNWAATSAVARGRIPADVAAAWKRIRALIAAAPNVSLVWAPADPVHDGRFAPPNRTIDLVQATWFHYPGKPWLRPAPTLRAIERVHPHRRILIDVSAAGPRVQKAAWLRAVIRAAEATRSIVVYHEGGPFAGDNPDRRSWSLTTLSARDVRQIVTDRNSGSRCNA